MRIVARVFGFTFNFIRRIIFIILFAIFVASHTISSVSAAVSAFFDTVLGVQTVAENLSQRLTRESDELAAARKKTADLESHNRKLSADVDDLKAKNVSLSRDVDDLKRKAAPDVNWKGKKMPLKDAVAEMSTTVKKRTAKVAAANLSSTFGESVPVYGIAVIVGVTAYELKSSCDTMKDMKELTSQIDPSYGADDETTHVCGLKVPTRDEILTKLKNSPEAAWQMAQSAYEGAVDLVPDWEQVKALPGSSWAAIKDAGSATGAWIAEGSGAAWDWTAENSATAWDKAGDAGGAVVEWWNSEDEQAPASESSDCWFMCD